ncbi:hypothetical protein CAEBREN_32564 [Caenorhabditis brenneri]|uniref:DUF7778 domain-containing protein n=1 Tax=Caenorhabditis brenneri TaxID=135651 RepID=G0MIL2_CAEBE|nr:hypothetical protein CAEBREN_32564 [Caenorhabditis brenneri]
MNAAQQQAPSRHPKCYTLQVADRLDKYISLPPRPKFKVNEVLQRGEVYSFIRSKSSFIFPDNISKVKSRSISVTTSGFMIIYENDDMGLVVDLRRVLNVICHADRLIQKAKKLNYFRCHIKIRLPRGNIHIFVRDEDVHKWTCAIMRASAKPGKCQKMPRNVEVKEEDVLVTAVEEEGRDDDVHTILHDDATLVRLFRCHIKIRLPRGNIHIFVRDEDVHKWTCAIMRASAKPGKCQKMPRNVEVKEEDVLVTAVEEEGEETMMFTPSSMMTATTCETCKEEEEEEEEEEECDYSEEEPEEEMPTVVENLFPIQNPTNDSTTTTSVRSLRQKLEKDLVMKPKEQVEQEQQKQLKKPLFVTELFCPPPVFNDDTIVLEPTSENERNVQEKEVEREQKWWTRSLRC